MVKPRRESILTRSATNYRRPTVLDPALYSNKSLSLEIENEVEEWKVNRKLEKYYGFHYLTSEFRNYPKVEQKYQEYFVRVNLNAACNTSLFVWCLWVLLSIPDAYGLFDEDPFVRIISRIDCLITFPVLLPVPVLIYLSKQQRFQRHLQIIMGIVVLCFAFSLIAGGIHSVMNEWGFHIEEDMKPLLNLAGISNSEEIIRVPDLLKSWLHYPHNSTRKSLIYHYLQSVVLPAAQLNINLARPVIVLVVAPAFKIQTSTFAVVAISVNFAYAMAVSYYYPTTRASYYITNKFLLAFSLIGITLILFSRVREADR